MRLVRSCAFARYAIFLIVVLLFLRYSVFARQSSSAPPSISTLAQSPKGAIFASAHPTGISLSTDGGLSWHQLGLTGISSAVAIDTGGTIFEMMFADGLYRSTDNGQTWSLKGPPGVINSVWALACSPKGYVLAGGDNIYRSTDAGGSWAMVNSLGYYDGVRSFVISPSGTVFAGTTNDLLRSTDDGVTWTSSGTGLTISGVWSLALNASGTVFAGGDQGRVCRSTNDGRTWTRITTVDYSGSVMSLIVRPAGVIFAAVYSQGIIYSQNDGTTWRIQVLPDNFIRSLLWTDTGEMLAGTHEGLFRSTDSGATWSASNDGLTGVAEHQTFTLRSYSLLQNYPNPFNPSTTLSYGLPTRSHVQLRVYNVLGQIVAELVNAEQEAGWNEVRWNATVTSGLYFCRLEAVSTTDPSKRFVDVKKMLMMK